LPKQWLAFFSIADIISPALPQGKTEVRKHINFMPEISIKTIIARNTKAIRLRWEFLRRNNEYAHDLAELKSSGRPAHQAWIDRIFNGDRTNHHRVLSNDRMEDIQRFALKWDLNFTIDANNYPSPETNFAHLTQVQKVILSPCSVKPHDAYFLSEKEFMIFKIKESISEIGNPKYDSESFDTLKVEINLTHPWRKITREIQNLIASIKKIRRKKGFKENAKPRTIEYFSELLKIYDLKTKKQMTLKQIYQELRKNNPNLSKTDKAKVASREDENRINKQYCRAKALVKSDYRNIIW
jgi:hypothetical protein